MTLPSCRSASRNNRFWRGNALGETALVMPVSVMMVLGTLDMGRLFYVVTSLSNAGREAAKTASLNNANFQVNGNAAVVRTAYCELQSFAWNFTPPAVANPCAVSNWSSWTPTPTTTPHARSRESSAEYRVPLHHGGRQLPLRRSWSRSDAGLGFDGAKECRPGQ